MLLLNNIKTSKKVLKDNLHPSIKGSILEFYESLNLKTNLEKKLKKNHLVKK